MNRTERLARYQRVVKMRNSGMTLAKIGAELKSTDRPNGVTRERARQIINEAKKALQTINNEETVSN